MNQLQHTRARAHRPGRPEAGGDRLRRGGDRVLHRRQDLQRRGRRRRAGPPACATLLEDARRAGKATGLVTTSQVTDATPAAYAAHVSDRAQQSEIARQFLESSKPDVILGGGEDFWFPAGNAGRPARPPGHRPDRGEQGHRGNLVERAQRLGYHYVSTRDGLRKANGRKVLGLFANEEMFEHREEGHGDLYDPLVPLPEMAAKALDVLSADRDGLFVLIEEEAIDEMAHENNAGLMIKSGAALDKTVGVARASSRAATPAR